MTALAAPVSVPSPTIRPSHLRLLPPVAAEPRTARSREDEARRLHPAVYRRRRLGVATAALAVGAAVWSVVPAGAGPAAPAPAAAPAPGAVHVVAPGDTIWSIARALQPEGDVRPTVDRLVRAHGSAVLQPGERITLTS